MCFLAPPADPCASPLVLLRFTLRVAWRYFSLESGCGRKLILGPTESCARPFVEPDWTDANDFAIHLLAKHHFR